MEYVGFSAPTDAVVVRGSLSEREFISFWHRDGIVTAAMNVNVWDVVEDLKAIVAGGLRLEPSRLADPGVPLADLAPQESDDQR
jgi:3-phenylpropionate/trans-cinnamate dioxygenase ferredoxin reductase subunit